MAGTRAGSKRILDVYRRFVSKERLLVFLAREVVPPDTLPALREVVLFGQPVSARAPDVDDATLVRELTCGVVAYLTTPCGAP